MTPGSARTAILKLAVERLRARFIVADLVRVQIHGQDVIGIEAQIHVLSAFETANEQPGGNQ